MPDQHVQQRINARRAQLDAARPLPAATVRRLQAQRAVVWTNNSNTSEGDTPTSRETQVIPKTGSRAATRARPGSSRRVIIAPRSATIAAASARRAC